METGERGFLIAGRDEYLEPYTGGIKSYKRLLSETKELVNDNPAQVRRLEAIDELVQQWHQVAGGPEIATRRKVEAGAKDADYLQVVLAKGIGKGILDNLRVVLEGLRANMIENGNQDAEILILSIAKDMVDQETGQRGFLITGKEEFLDPFVNGGKALARIFHQ